MSISQAVKIALKELTNKNEHETLSAIYETDDSWIFVGGVPGFIMTIGSPIISIHKQTGQISNIEYDKFFTILDNSKQIYKIYNKGDDNLWKNQLLVQL